MDRFTKPGELPYSPFTVNPQPDFTLTGRPLARLVPDSFNSEYSRRYVYLKESLFLFFQFILFSFVFPDATKVEKFPWLRSW